MRYKLVIYIIVFYTICALFIILIQNNNYSETPIKRYLKHIVVNLLNNEIGDNKPYKVFEDNIDDNELTVKRIFNIGIYNIVTVSYIVSLDGDKFIMKILYNGFTNDCTIIDKSTKYTERLKSNIDKKYLDDLQLLSPTDNDIPPGYRNVK